MATVVLSAAGAAIGSSVGGSVLGLSATAVGRFVGGAIGQRIDQRSTQTSAGSAASGGSELVETARIERFRLTNVGEGNPIAQVFGRMRVGGQVIWATEFREDFNDSRHPDAENLRVREFTYSVSLAIALCEGEITSISRVWADGSEISLSLLSMRVYRGTHDQLPDPAIEAVEGVGQTPAYRGLAYVVLEDLQLEPFGNRVPSLSFEVTRPDLAQDDVPMLVKAVALIPGTGEYALNPGFVRADYNADEDSLFFGGRAVVNANSASRRSDLSLSLKQLNEEVPDCRSASLVVSWFGDDLRCGSCHLRPKVEQSRYDGRNVPWEVAGLTRKTAQLIPRLKGRPIYGGTPTDQSVIAAITRLKLSNKSVTYYPFILMTQLSGNDLPDPWTGQEGQPALPWRGRITLHIAPGQEGSAEGTSGADAQVAAFFGDAVASDFEITGQKVTYSGPNEWRYRRFILHQAALCKAAGGVEAFCIGSEMRALTQVRGETGFPAVQALRELAADCRAILGPATKIGYAADWSEYFGYHPQDGSGDVYFHLDPLWADSNIDFVGIDNYMPLSDWRDGDDHADADWSSIYNTEYLKANIEGGEGYEWFYPTQTARDFQRREPIRDDTHGEPWIWRYKDIRNWWSHEHFDRVGGQRADLPTSWVPQSKPVWFTELGCAAIDKGSNEPNKFLDEKSSESRLPHYSNGIRDETIQREYLRAQLGYWSQEGKNPVSNVYGGPMLDMSRAFVWAWDARPFPWFPANENLWGDGPNYRRGHWINGRASGRRLSSVVAEICRRSGVTHYDVSQLHGIVRGYALDSVGSGRHALQPLMLAYGFDAVERDGQLRFAMRDGRKPVDLDLQALALDEAGSGEPERSRSNQADVTGRVRMHFVQADADHQIAAEESIHPGDGTDGLTEVSHPLLFTRAEARQVTERWLAEARLAQDSLRFSLPPSMAHVGAGDILRLPLSDGDFLARVDRAEVTDRLNVDAVAIDPEVYRPSIFPDETARVRPVTESGTITPVFMDLPLITGDEVPHAPYIAANAEPWPGSLALYDAPEDQGYALNRILAARATIGVTETPLFRADLGRIDRAAPLRIRLAFGALFSISDAAFLSGGNLMAIGSGSGGQWELFQYRDALLLEQDRWQVSHRLRGQAGSDAVMPDVWPAGSYVVAMNGVPQQFDMASLQRGVARHYRIGPASFDYTDEAYTHHEETFFGAGLRPYKPVHLRRQSLGSDDRFEWIRRSRVDGDNWDGLDIALGESVEAYLIRVTVNGAILRETQVTHSVWTYSAASRASDGVLDAYTVHVAQISERYGAGPFASLTVT